MRKLNEALTLTRYTIRVRRATVVVLGASVGLAFIFASTTVPNLLGDPSIPRNRVTLVISCLIASLVVTLVQPIDIDAERLAARSLVSAKVVLALGTVGLTVGALWLATIIEPGPSDGFGLVPRNVAGLIGLGLTLAAVRLWLGLLAPWILAFGGALFGYEPHPGAAATVRPWAWLLDVEPRAANIASVLLGVGLLLWLIPTRR